MESMVSLLFLSFQNFFARHTPSALALIIVGLFSLLLSQSVSAAEANKLVDVDKNSKLSDYFKKINPKVSDSSEEKSLIVDEKEEAETPARAEDQILLSEARSQVKKSTQFSPANKMVIAIFAILLVATFLLLALQKFSKNKGHAEIARNITVLTQKSIGPKKNLMLIRVAGETILLGVIDNSINHIKTLSLMDDELPSYTEPKFRSQLQEKIEMTRTTDEIEQVDGFAVSRLDEVKKTVAQRFNFS